ncbi:MAG: ABC transporter ATP-binding protein [Acidobacteriota bacterium]
MKPVRGIHEEAVLGKAYDARLIRWLWQWVRPHRSLVILSLGLFACVSIAQLAQPYLVKVAIDRFMLPGNQEGLTLLALLFLLTMIGEFFFRYAEIYVLEKTGQAVVFDLRTSVFAHVQRLPCRFFDHNPVGRILTRITTDIESLNEVFASGVVTVIGDVLKLAGIIIVMLWMNAHLALVTFAIIPAMLGLSLFFRLRLRGAYRVLRLRIARINSSLNESIGGMGLVQLFRRQERHYAEFKALNRRHMEADTGSVLYDSLFSAAVEWIGTLSVALIIWYGGGQIVHQAITFGVLIAFIEYTQRFFVPIRELSTKYAVMQSAMAASERLAALLEEKPEPGILAACRPAHASPTTPRGRIIFENVSFQYHAGEDVLRDISLQVKPGEKIALVGLTGSGKTTLIKLLVRLYGPTAGRILLDGEDIRGLDPRTLRRRIGLVMQDGFLFRGTIASNISLNDPSLTRDDIEAAARAVQAHTFIQRLAGGYDHPIRPRGTNLSAGQKQLLTFARALAFDPEVLVLDEATSSVDPGTEARIQLALARLTHTRTSLIIAHRLSTITGVDRILVLHHGSIREEGTHDELLCREGLYAQLHRIQIAAERGPSAPPHRERPGSFSTGMPDTGQVS